MAVNHWCKHPSCLESLDCYPDEQSLAVHTRDAHTSRTPAKYPRGSTVEAKFSSSSRTWKLAQIREDQGARGLLVTFEGFDDETLIPRARIRQQRHAVTLADCLNSTVRLQHSASSEGLADQSSDERAIPAQIDRRVRDFASGSGSRLSLPPSLSSYQRRLVHGLCDQLGLSSKSRGEGQERHLVVERGARAFWAAHRPLDSLEGCVIGQLQVSRRRRAEAWVIREDGKPDVHLSDEKDRNRALDGDVVAVDVSKEAACVVAVVQRQHRARVAGLLKALNEAPAMIHKSIPPAMRKDLVRVFEPFDRRWPYAIIELPKAARVANAAPAEEGCSRQKQIWCARFDTDSWSDTYRFPRAKLEAEPLGALDDLATQLEVCAIENGTQTSAPPAEVLAECELSEQEASATDRVDMRELLVLSIDPEGARDLDDALHIRQLSDTVVEVGIHIADVASAVRASSHLDQFAAARATTVYLPNRNYPMLPRALCDNICSLHGGVDRPCFSVITQLDAQTGDPVAPPRFILGTIQSTGKLSYEAAQRIIELKPEVLQEIQHRFGVDLPKAEAVSGAIKQLNALAVVMRAARMQSGGCHSERQLQGPSYYVRDGAVHRYEDESEAAEAHHLVEEFMLLANRMVAERLIEVYPQHAVVRCQPPPQEKRIKSFVSQCQMNGYKADNIAELQKVLQADAASDDPKQVLSARVLQLQLQRCSSPAEYICTGLKSQEQWKHTSLGFAAYSHFTSPIRRYADLLVHRMLLESEVLHLESPTIGDPAAIGRICQSINDKAKRAKWAQRDAEKVCMCAHLLQNGGSKAEPAVVLTCGERYITLLVPSLGEEVDIKVADAASSFEWDADSHTLKMCLLGDNDEKIVLRPMSHVLIDVSATMQTVPPELRATIVQPSQWPDSGLKLIKQLSDDILLKATMRDD